MWVQLPADDKKVSITDVTNVKQGHLGPTDNCLNVPVHLTCRTCRGVACPTHIRRCFHIDLIIKNKNLLDFIREISIMNL